jgi:gliding motility-associated-like protein
MDFLLPIVVADFNIPTTGCSPFTFPTDNLSLTQSATTFLWSFGDGTTSTQFEPNHTYPSPGVYTITLIVSDTATCNLDDTLSKTITILGNNNTQLPDAIICGSGSVQIGIPQNNDPSLTYQWIPNTYLSDTSITNPLASPPTNTTYMLIVNNGVCNDTIVQNVIVDQGSVTIIGDSLVCSIDAPYLLSASTVGIGINYTWSNFSDFSDTINANPLATSVSVPAPDSINWYYLSMITSYGCVVTDSFKIIVLDELNPLPASFDNPGPGCAPYTINLNNTTPGTAQTTYYWDFGNGTNSTATNPTITYNSKGNYWITLIVFDSAICPTSDTLSILVQTREDSAYTVTHFACANQDTEIGIPADTVPGTTYTWIPTTGLSDPSIHNPTVNTTSDLTYLLIVQHVCTDSVTDIVIAEPIFAQTQDLVVLCSDNPNVTLSGFSQGTGVNFVWSSQPNFSDTLNTASWDSTVSINQTNATGTYYFSVESQNGCFATDTTTVIISDLLVDITPDKYICQGDTIELTATNTYPENPMDFFWSPASEIIGSANQETITVAPLSPTTYYIQAVNDSGCVYRDSVFVDVSPLNEQMITVTADLDSIISGTSTFLHALPAPGFNYSWSPSNLVSSPNSADTEAFPKKTTTFTVTVSDPKNGKCAYKKDIEIRVYEIVCDEPYIFIPNAFSPNYDGNHDAYKIEGQVIESLELKIYNRWGQLVFETTDKGEAWDGKFKDVLVDPEVFVYHLNAVCIDGQEFTKKGNITVIR